MQILKKNVLVEENPFSSHCKPFFSVTSAATSLIRTLVRFLVFDWSFAASTIWNEFRHLIFRPLWTGDELANEFVQYLNELISERNYAFRDFHLLEFRFFNLNFKWVAQFSWWQRDTETVRQSDWAFKSIHPILWGNVIQTWVRNDATKKTNIK